MRSATTLVSPAGPDRVRGACCARADPDSARPQRPAASSAVEPNRFRRLRRQKWSAGFRDTAPYGIKPGATLRLKISVFSVAWTSISPTRKRDPATQTVVVRDPATAIRRASAGEVAVWIGILRPAGRLRASSASDSAGAARGLSAAANTTLAARGKRAVRMPALSLSSEVQMTNVIGSPGKYTASEAARARAPAGL